jgi:hypothetical protein
MNKFYRFPWVHLPAHFDYSNKLAKCQVEIEMESNLEKQTNLFLFLNNDQACALNV